MTSTTSERSFVVTPANSFYLLRNSAFIPPLAIAKSGECDLGNPLAHSAGYHKMTS